VNKKTTGNLIAGLDPGKVNYGYAIIDPDTGSVVEHGLNASTIQVLTQGFSAQHLAYIKFLRSLKRKGCTHVVAERFQMRGTSMGTLIELVSFMAGSLASEFPGRLKLVIASQWKNAYSASGLDLDSFYEEMSPVTPHQIDACLMGVWAACRMKKIDLPKKKTLKEFVSQAKQPTPSEIKAIQNKLKVVKKKEKKRKMRTPKDTTL
jgi:hypothetical protein